MSDDLWKGGPEWADQPPTLARPNPEAVLCDYSYAKPDPSQVKTGGVVVYSSRNPAKVPSQAHVQRLLALGKTVSWVGQDGGAQSLRGTAGGIDDARWHNGLLDKFDAPDWLPIALAVDFDASAVDLAGPIRGYFAAAVSTSKRPVGVYGGIRTITAMQSYFGDALAWYWQAVAWSAGRVSPHAHLLQQAGAPWFPIPGVPTDDSLVLRPFPRWGHGLSDTDRSLLASAGADLAATTSTLTGAR